jgi:histidine ammonia-lyase
MTRRMPGPNGQDQPEAETSRAGRRRPKPGSALVLDDRLSLAELAEVAVDHRPVRLADAAIDRIMQALAAKDQLLERSERVYGLTTGVGALKRVTVSAEEQSQFNRRLLLAHRTGTGPLVGEEVVRATMLAQLAGFARGRSGVGRELAEVLVGALNAGLRPHVRTTGSLGQSDLGPLADMATALTGEEGWSAELERKGLKPWRPEAKEALAFRQLQRVHAWLDGLGPIEDRNTAGPF